MRAFDWTKTPLGPPQLWPQSLKTAVRIMLTSRQPIWIGWGEQLIYLYNDPYKSIIGGKHPLALGQPTSVVWGEIWDVIGPMLKAATTGDTGTYVEAQLLIMERNGYPEETYYTYSYTPVPDDEGGTGGIICANSDDTQRVISERQLTLLRDLATVTADRRTWQEVCEYAAAVLATNSRDLPFAMLYMSEADGQSMTLIAQSGIERGHPAAPDSVPLNGGGHAWGFGAVLAKHVHQTVEDLSSFADLPSGAWSKPPSRAIILPIAVSGENSRAGALVIGLNPFRLLDEGYLGFLNLVAGQISAAIAVAEAYEQERKRAESLAQLDHAKTAFFSNVSHEFRTPLTLMLGPTEDALASEADPQQRERLEVIRRNGLRLQRLVNTLLDFSRIEAGRVQASYVPTDVFRLTADLASVFRSAIERAGMRLVITCPPAGGIVHIDRDMYEKIVLNLVSNAFKYTFEGEIEIALRDASDSVELSVRDTGIGIAEHEVPRLFERFHRVEGARARTHEGSGIGLALVYELVKLHHGTIRVESRLGAGSTFFVTLPKGTGHLATSQSEVSSAMPSTALAAEAFVEEASRWLPLPEVDESTSTEPIGPSSSSEAPNTNDHVLLADDNHDMREYVRRLLRGRFHVEAVGDGAAALASARARKPSLIITDVMMPVLDGFGLLREIRADATLRDVPVLMLSARAGEESRLEGLRAGADDYLVKPFSGRELMARVSAHLELSRLRREGEARERELRNEAEALNEVALVLGAELDLPALVQKVTDIGTDLTHAAFGAFFYNTIDERGESYTLYTLSGAPREAFAKFGMPRATQLFGPTFRGEGVIRIHDVLQDPRYGKNPPHAGMPKGHLPVRSYLAAPVISRSGEVLGGLFFGHPQPGIFTEHAERIAAGIAAQAAVAIDNARLYGQSQREVAERTGAEEAVRRRETQLQALLDQAPMGICLLDSDLTFRHVNPVARPSFGVQGDLKGVSFASLMAQMWPPQAADDIVSKFRGTLETGQSYHVREFADGRRESSAVDYYDWQVHRVPLPDGTNGVVCYFTNITDHVRAREALADSEGRTRQLLESERAARTEAERAGRMKDEFLATLSHELRTPLNAILGWTHLLRKSPPSNEDIRQGLAVIERNARVQTQLIADLLDMSRIISGKMRLDVHGLNSRSSSKRHLKRCDRPPKGEKCVCKASWSQYPSLSMGIPRGCSRSSGICFPTRSSSPPRVAVCRLCWHE